MYAIRSYYATKFHFLRQQTDKVSQSRNGEIFPNYCLADYVAPKESGKADYFGAFAVTGGVGEAEIAEAYKAAVITSYSIHYTKLYDNPSHNAIG